MLSVAGDSWGGYGEMCQGLGQACVGAWKNLAGAGLDPLGQFQVKTWLPMHLGALDISMTNSSFYMLVAAILPLVLFRLALGGRMLIPGSAQVAAESAIQFVEKMLIDANGAEGARYTPIFASLFLFLLGGNMLGMIPGAFTFTSQIVVTLGLALGMFVWMTGLGIYKQKGGFLRLFLPSSVPVIMAPLFVPIELISYCSRPLSLGVRLFANMMAGHAMMKVFAYFTLSAGVFGIAPFVINVALTGFELLVAFLQAYVFTVLCSIYLKDSLHSH